METATIATFVQRMLDEQHWSFREQERHTNVSAQTVYNLTLENTVRTTEVLKFTVAAKYLVLDDEDRRFWCALEARLRETSYPSQLTAEMQDHLSKSVAASLQEADVKRPQPKDTLFFTEETKTNDTMDTVVSESSSLERELREVIALYESLSLEGNRQAVRQLLQSLNQVECVCHLSTEPRRSFAWWKFPRLTALFANASDIASAFPRQ
jgi:hypothetical protein